MKNLIQLVMIMLCIACTSCSNATEITGTVKDQNGNPIVGAMVNITRNGASIAGTFTGKNGYYFIKTTMADLNKDYELTASYKGYQTYIITQLKATSYNERIVQNFNLKVLQANTAKDSTVVYKKAVTVVQKEEIKLMPVTTDKRSAGNATADRSYSNTPPPFPNLRRGQYAPANTETYKKYPENDFKVVSANPLSTLSVDVDRASYSNVRRFINQGQMPPADAVRVEEMINYFDYQYAQPTGKNPIAIVTEITDCPWQPKHKLLHVGMQAKKINTDNLPPSNLVFLIDVSGSMYNANKLPLAIAAMKLLANNLREQDKISIVVYAGSSGLVLPPTSGSNKTAIYDALDKLKAGGSTAGGAGIKLAYKIATDNFIKKGNNRVILATDGDFNVGVRNENDLEDLIVSQRDKGIYLTCLGFGNGNYKDSKMELLADKGNGNYAYIDNILEAQKTLVTEFGGTIFTVAKDVKAQIEFNPAYVQGYRLVGYENRLLNEEDFTDDKKDAGDMGSGHSVTIIYEIIPTGVKSPMMKNVPTLKYQTKRNNNMGHELATIKFRYKKPSGGSSIEMVHTIKDRPTSLKNASTNARFATSVAMYGMLLKNSAFKGSITYDDVLALAKNARGVDDQGYRSEFIRLVSTTKSFNPKQQQPQEDVWDY